MNFKYWWDNTYLHHRWVMNGPLWWLCRDCRALHSWRRSKEN